MVTSPLPLISQPASDNSWKSQLNIRLSLSPPGTTGCRDGAGLVVVTGRGLRVVKNDLRGVVGLLRLVRALVVVVVRALVVVVGALVVDGGLVVVVVVFLPV